MNEQRKNDKNYSYRTLTVTLFLGEGLGLVFVKVRPNPITLVFDGTLLFDGFSVTLFAFFSGLQIQNNNILQETDFESFHCIPLFHI